MKEIHITSFNDFYDNLKNYQKSNLWLFRGHSSPDWLLIPKAGRPPFCEYNDISQFEAWKRRAVEYLSTELRDDWDWLAIAQHHGLATRLLDWTFNPLVAAFFACQNNKSTDAIVYAYHSYKHTLIENKAPFDYKGIIRFKPRGVTQRISRQSAIFTLHSPPDLPLEDELGPNETLEKFIIQKTYINQLSFDLNLFGINWLSLFPDLDGLSSHVNWVTTNVKFWDTKNLDDIKSVVNNE